MDARQHLQSLVGKEIQTLTGRPNRILSVGVQDATVATGKSPEGKPVPIAWVQDAIDTLEREREIEINVDTVGYRSAFISAVLLTLPGAAGDIHPPQVTLR